MSVMQCRCSVELLQTLQACNCQPVSVFKRLTGGALPVSSAEYGALQTESEQVQCHI